MVVLIRVVFFRAFVERWSVSEPKKKKKTKKQKRSLIDTARFQLLRAPLSLYFLREAHGEGEGLSSRCMPSRSQVIECSRKDCPAKGNYRKKALSLLCLRPAFLPSP